MILVYVSIPFMVLAFAIATVPLIWAMRIEHRQQQHLLALPSGPEAVAARGESLPVTAGVTDGAGEGLAETWCALLAESEDEGAAANSRHASAPASR